MIRNLLYSVVVILMFSGFSKAQNNASLDGYITDAKTGDSLISANIAFQNTKKGTSSDIRGYFTIQNINPGVDTLVFTYIGYEEFRMAINLNQGEKRTLEIQLIPQNQELEDIVVQSQAGRKRQNEIEMVEVSIAFILNLPAVVESDVFRAVQLLPGIKATSDFSSGLYIRGGSPDQTLILLDETPIYHPNHLFGFYSTFNPDVVQNVNLYKGVYPAEFGGRLGSVLSIDTREGNAENLEGSVSAGLLASRASLGGPVRNGSWFIAARRSTFGPILEGLRQNMDDIPKAYHFYDVNGSLNYDLTLKDKLSMSFYAGKDQILHPVSVESELNLDYGNQAANFRWKHLFSDKLFAKFTAFGSRYFNNPKSEVVGTTHERGNNIHDFTIKTDWGYLAGDYHCLSAGIRAGVITVKLQDWKNGDEVFDSRQHHQTASAYLQDKWQVFKKLKLTPGLRFNYFSGGNFTNVEPRLSMQYEPSERFMLQASYGHYTQFMSLSSDKGFSGFDIWTSSSEEVSPSTGEQYVLGAKTLPFDDIGFDVEVYYRTMTNLFELNPFVPDIAGMEYTEMFRSGEGSAFGLEVFLEKKAGKFTGFIGYTLGYTFRKFSGYNVELGNEEQEARFYPPKHDRRNDFNLVASYQFTSHWSATLSFNYATGQAYTKPLGRYTVRNVPVDYGLHNVFTVGKVNADRLPAYHRMDFALSRTGNFFNIGESELQLQLINVYSRRNVWFYNYSFYSNPVERMEVNLLPMLPSISYSIKF